MLTYFPVGPNEQQTWSVAYMTPGTRVASIVLEHMNEKAAIREAGKLNAAAAREEKAVQLERELCGMRRIQRDLQGVL
jgi:hypothetical protein